MIKIKKYSNIKFDLYITFTKQKKFLERLKKEFFFLLKNSFNNSEPNRDKKEILNLSFLQKHVALRGHLIKFVIFGIHSNIKLNIITFNSNKIKIILFFFNKN